VRLTWALSRTSAVAGVTVAAAALVLAGCGSSSKSMLGAGSSFQDPMEQAWISGFASTAKSEAKITYNPIGSGDGISQFGAGSTNFAGSDVPMKPDEQSAADKTCGSTAIHIPVTAGGVGITYNLSGFSKLQLSPGAIASIFTGKAKFWDDPVIRADNKGTSLPHQAISVFTRADDSGTTAVFTGFLTATDPTDWTLGSDKHIEWPVGQGKQQSAGVAGAVKATPGGVTYVEQAYASQQGLSLAAVQNGSGSYVTLTPQNVSTALTTAKLNSTSGNDLTMTLNFAPENPSAYPISTVSYVIVCTTYPTSFKYVDELKAYLNYAVTTGQQKATSIGFAPLPASLVSKDQASIGAISSAS